MVAIAILASILYVFYPEIRAKQKSSWFKKESEESKVKDEVTSSKSDLGRSRRFSVQNKEDLRINRRNDDWWLDETFLECLEL